MEKKLSIIIALYNQEELIIKALNSIPERNDIETIVIDDASTDNSKINVINYINNSKKDIKFEYNLINQGVGYTKNVGLDIASGEYIVELDSDDWFITNTLNKCFDALDGTDLIYFDLEINDKSIFKLNNDTKNGYCGSTKFIRKDFIGNIRYKNIRGGEDYYFYKELLNKHPTEKFLNKVVKHYNFPRENSLSWKMRNGEIHD